MPGKLIVLETESGESDRTTKTETQQGLDKSYLNCQGWMNMACCLKARLEYGINLWCGRPAYFPVQQNCVPATFSPGDA